MVGYDFMFLAFLMAWDTWNFLALIMASLFVAEERRLGETEMEVGSVTFTWGGLKVGEFDLGPNLPDFFIEWLESNFSPLAFEALKLSADDLLLRKMSLGFWSGGEAGYDIPTPCDFILLFLDSNGAMLPWAVWLTNLALTRSPIDFLGDLLLEFFFF